LAIKVVLFEDSKYTNFFPISRMRTVADIRTGRYTQKERATTILNCPVMVHSERGGFGDKIKLDKDTLFLNARVVNFDIIKEI